MAAHGGTVLKYQWSVFCGENKNAKMLFAYAIIWYLMNANEHVYARWHRIKRETSP